MKILIGLAALAALAAPAATTQAQQPPPPGSYQRSCSNIYMQGQYLHAYCRGSNGAGESTLNVLSCATDIWVDPTGALTCRGPEAAARDREQGYRAPPAYGPAPPYAAAPGYRDRDGYGREGYRRDAYGRGREWAELFARPNLRGRSLRIDGEAPDLDDSGLNDRVRSIRLPRRSGPWLVCEDAGYRGRCETVTATITDTRRIGLDGISSLRPLY